MNKILHIVGSTASGKTGVALDIAAKIFKKSGKKVAIISADSKQVYLDLMVLSGADVPANFSFGESNGIPCYKSEYADLYGVGFLSLADEWSVAGFRELAREVVDRARARDTQVIVVGGAGLYHQALVWPDSLVAPAPPNLAIRARASGMSLSDLQALVQQEALNLFNLLNDSDKANPRRLVRVLERKAAGVTDHDSSMVFGHNENHVFVGLSTPPHRAKDFIATRVHQRWENGAIAEVEKLRTTPNVASTANSLLGVKEISDFLDGVTSETQSQELWAEAEFRYRKRQATWFKKVPQITWFTTPYDLELVAQQASELIYSNT